MLKLDVVMPLAPWDVQRFDIFYRSFERFWALPHKRIVIVVPHDNLSEMRAALSRYAHLDIVPDTVVAPPGPTSWWKQMLIKLAAHTLVETEHYLTIDADMFLCRRLDEQACFRDGKLVFAHEKTPIAEQERWYERVQSVLTYDKRPEHRIFPSACFHSMAIMRSLVNRLSALAEGVGEPDWQTYLMRRTGWLELGLYHVHGWNAGLWDSHHFEVPRTVGNSIWHLRDAETWDPRPSFQVPDFLFTVVQSNTKLTAEWTWQRVAPYL